MTSKEEAGSASARGNDCSPGFSCEGILACIKSTVKRGLHSSGRMRVIDWRTEHKAVCRLCLLDERIHDIVKDAFFELPALSAGNAVLHGFCAEPEDLRLNSRLAERLCDFLERSIGTSRSARASVDKQNFHMRPPTLQALH